MEHLTDKRKETNWCVYMHENRFNGKKYIGITSQKPNNRWRNGKHYDYNVHFYAAIQKYGWDGFHHEILYTGLTQEEAERLEVELIAKYQTQDYNKGYNSASGGRSRSGWQHTDEAKERIGARTRGTHLSEDHKKRIGDAQRGEKNHAYGKHLSDEHKQKMSVALKGHDVSEETRERIRQTKRARHARAVVCLETGVRFGSVAEAAEEIEMCHSCIIACCQGRAHTAGGFHWRYADEAVTVDV